MGEQKEEWRGVPGWKHYEISNLDRVRSLDRYIGGDGCAVRPCRGRVLARRVRTCGGLGVFMSEDGRAYGVSIARIKTAVHYGLRLNDPTWATLRVNGEPSDDHIDNLRPVTRRGVSDHIEARGARVAGEGCGQSVLKEDDVRHIIDALAEGDSVMGTARRMGVSRGAVRAIREGRSWARIEYGHRFSRSDIGSKA